MNARHNLQTFYPENSLTAANAPEFRELINTAINDQQVNAVLINLANVSLVDSAAAVLFVQATRLAQSQGKEFALCNLNSQVGMILELTQLDRFLCIYEDETAFAVRDAYFLAAA